MRSHVTLEQPRSGEAFATDVAFAGQCMSASVHLESRQRCVALIAKFARKCLLDLVGSVQLQMLDVTRLR